MGEELKKEEAVGAPAPEADGASVDAAAIDESATTRSDEPSQGMPDWLRFPLVLGIVGAVSAAALAGVFALTKKRMEESEGRKVEGAFGSILGKRYRSAASKTDAEGREYYVLKDGDGKTLAYAAQVACPGSYNTGDPIQLIVVLEPGLERMLGARVVKSAETPGLGERIKEKPSAMSIVGWIAGREAKRRVVLKSSGALLGKLVEKDDGSVELIGSDGKPLSLAKGEYLEITEAPFPPEFIDQFTLCPVADATLAADGGSVDAITGATISSRAVTKGVGEAAKLLRKALERP
jgi:Na+-translocating ferredoxin:NAD+ oxidoreductase RnfG subunit